MNETFETTLAKLRAEEALRDQRRRAAALVGSLLLVPACAALGILAWVMVGCNQPTIGGGAGRENDPCRDSGLVFFTSLAIATLLWFFLRGCLKRWSRPGREPGRGSTPPA